jgi:hypothetical protein
MTIVKHCDNKIITDGSASRFIREEWLIDSSIDATAFDLRDISPPETYVSFFIVIGNDIKSKFNNAEKKIPKNLISQGGAIVILEIKQCLDDINDELDDLISFKKEKGAHCGLYYLTTDLQKIVEIKNTLCLLAKENFLKVSIQNNSLANKTIPV